MKIIIIVGARPNFMKAAPIINVLDGCSELLGVALLGIELLGIELAIIMMIAAARTTGITILFIWLPPRTCFIAGGQMELLGFFNTGPKKRPCNSFETFHVRHINLSVNSLHAIVMSNLLSLSLIV